MANRASVIRVLRCRGESAQIVAMNVLKVTRLLHRLRGSSHPVLAEADDGATYVVKLSTVASEPWRAFNEAAGSLLFSSCGLPVPDWSPVLVSRAHIDEASQARLTASSGSDSQMCFGSRFLGSDGGRIFEILPQSYFARVQRRSHFWTAWLLDICAGNRDPRQVIFKEVAERKLQPYFIDSGEMFSSEFKQSNAAVNACRFLDDRVYPSLSSGRLDRIKRTIKMLDVDRLWASVGELPEEWNTRDRQVAFSACLTRLASEALTGVLLDEVLVSLDIARNQSRIP